MNYGGGIDYSSNREIISLRRAVSFFSLARSLSVCPKTKYSPPLAAHKTHHRKAKLEELETSEIT